LFGSFRSFLNDLVSRFGELHPFAASTEHNMDMARSSEGAAQSWPSGTTVLLVDDEKQVTRGLCALLHGLDLVVLQAHSGDEALSILRRCKVDVVVSDECMPGMRGSEFLSIVSREFPDTGRVLLTGHATVESAVRSINEAKVCRFLQKPCRPEEFRAAIVEAHRMALHARMTARLLDFARLEGLDLSAKESTSKSASPGNRPDLAHTGGFDPGLLATLSAREHDVFDLIVDGLRISQIAEALFISRHTVRNHLKSIFEKLDMHSQTEILARSRGRRGNTLP
jgi:DNA-binding NarL/FixJ family response regulator